MGFEPMISCLLGRRFNQLSHGALCNADKKKKEIRYVVEVYFALESPSNFAYLILSVICNNGLCCRALCDLKI